MEFIQKLVDAANTIIWSYCILILAIGVGLYYLIRTRGVQFRKLGEIIRLVFGKESQTDADKAAGSAEGGIKGLQSLFVAVGGCVGTGNVAGVALAITAGGPGAVFWMWVIGLLGAGTSFIENTLAQVFKEHDERGGFRGGPAYYMEKGLGKRWVGIVFAVCMILSFGMALAALQANTISEAWVGALGCSKWVSTIIIVAFAAVVIYGGAKRIAKVSEIIVPTMAIVYLVAALIVLVINVKHIPAMFAAIFNGAFNVKALGGGAVGTAILQGVKRGVFSSGAGQGDSPQASASAVTTHPARQGLIQSFAIYIDTILICSATAFVCISAQSGDTDLAGIKMVQASFASAFGDWAKIFIAFIMFLFCFSSLIANYYYAESNLAFILRGNKGRNLYRIVFLLVLLWGGLSGLGIVWDFADVFGGSLAVVNLIVLVFLGNISVEILKDYESQEKAGIAVPTFNIKSIEKYDLSNAADCWKDK